jgi:hypothetical protein
MIWFVTSGNVAIVVTFLMVSNTRALFSGTAALAALAAGADVEPVNDEVTVAVGIGGPSGASAVRIGR